MKFNKTYGIFLLTFSIGCILVLAPGLFDRPKKEPELNKLNTPKVFTEKSKKVKHKLPIVEEYDSWIHGEKDPLKMQLLETGESFHGEEVDARSGEKWLGLFHEKGEYLLKPTRLKIRKVFDIMATPETKEKTGKGVSVAEKGEPIFLIKNSGLKIGNVKTLFHGNRYEDMPDDPNLDYDEFITSIDEGFLKEFDLNGDKYTLKVIQALNQDREKVFALVLDGLGKRQVLHTLNVQFNEQGLGILHWVGDIDGDDKLDIYMRPFVHYNVENRVLFLSSKAKQGQLLDKAAYFWTTGC